MLHKLLIYVISWRTFVDISWDVWRGNVWGDKLLRREMFWRKCLGVAKCRGGRDEYRDLKNQFSFTRKT